MEYKFEKGDSVISIHPLAKSRFVARNFVIQTVICHPIISTFKGKIMPGYMCYIHAKVFGIPEILLTMDTPGNRAAFQIQNIAIIPGCLHPNDYSTEEQKRFLPIGRPFKNSNKKKNAKVFEENVFRRIMEESAQKDVKSDNKKKESTQENANNDDTEKANENDEHNNNVISSKRGKAEIDDDEESMEESNSNMKTNQRPGLCLAIV